MKDFKYKYYIVFISLLLYACQVSSNNNFIWKHNGIVSDSKGKLIQLKMQNVYGGREYNNELYLIGYQIDKTGINYPTVARVSSQLVNPEYWPFDNDLQDIFIHKNTLYISDAVGTVFSANGSQWVPSTIKLKPDSRVIESNKDIIACYPSSLLKELKKTGACYSVDSSWRIAINWRTTKPKICNGRLYAFESNLNGKFVKAFDLTDGKILSSKPVKKIPSDLCNVNF